jgi:hypothetical protein
MKTNTQIDKVVDDLKVLGRDADELVRATAGDAARKLCVKRVCAWAAQSKPHDGAVIARRSE